MPTYLTPSEAHVLVDAIQASLPVPNATQLGTEHQTNWTLPPNILGSGAK